MDRTIEENIIEAEEQLRKAMLNSDIDALNVLLAPELLFTNHFGQVITKSQDIEAHASGAFIIKGIVLTEKNILPRKDVVVVSVKAKIVGSYNENDSSGDFRFTRVWIPSPRGAWHVIAGHSCVIT